jgi:hypothetical protein
MSCGQINDYRELIPEFFFDPTFLRNDNRFDLGRVDGEPVDHVILPKWAKSPMDFIYIHRKALESHYVSAHLPEWIDLIWGYKQSGQEAVDACNTFDPSLYESIWESDDAFAQKKMIECMMENSGHIPTQLFWEPHAQKLKTTVHSFSLLVNLEFQKMRFGCFSKLNNKLYKYFCLGPQNYFHEISVSLTEPIEVVQKTLQSVESINFAQVGVFDKSMKLIAVTDVGAAVVVDARSIAVTHLTQRIISCIAVSNNLLVTGGHDTITDIWNLDSLSAPVHNVTSFRDEIVCCAVCDEFKTVASATRDGSISLISTSTGTTSRVIEVGPKSTLLVSVTSGWGFVVAHTTETVHGIISYFIEVYTVNGDAVRQRVVDFQIKSWAHWCSVDGFDYCAAVSDKGDLYVFETFYLNMGKPFVSLTEGIVTLKYFVDEEVLAVATDSQLLFFSNEQMGMGRLKRDVFGDDE